LDRFRWFWATGWIFCWGVLGCRGKILYGAMYGYRLEGFVWQYKEHEQKWGCKMKWLRVLVPAIWLLAAGLGVLGDLVDDDFVWGKYIKALMIILLIIFIILSVIMTSKMLRAKLDWARRKGVSEDFPGDGSKKS
jgi:hypothetical protein